MRYPFVAPFSMAGSGGLRLDLGVLLSRLWRQIRNWFAKQAVLAELAELDQRTLDDLRITPSDFQAIAEGSFKREAAWENQRMALDLAKLARMSAERPYQFYL